MLQGQCSVFGAFAGADVTTDTNYHPAPVNLGGAAENFDRRHAAVFALHLSFDATVAAFIDQAVIALYQLGLGHSQGYGGGICQQLLAGSAGIFARGVVDIQKSQGFPVNQINHIHGHVHGGPKTLQIGIVGVYLGQVDGQAFVAIKESVAGKLGHGRDLQKTRVVGGVQATVQLAERLPGIDLFQPLLAISLVQ